MTSGFTVSEFPTFFRLAKGSARFVRRSIKPVAVALVLLLVAHAVLMVVWGWQLENRLEQIRRSGEPATSADLTPNPIPDSENGAVAYERAFKILDRTNSLTANPDAEYTPIEKYLSAPNSDAAWSVLGPDIKTLVHNAAPVYPIVEQATDCSKCVFPISWKIWPATQFPHYQKLKNAGLLIAAKAIMEARNGQMDGSVNDVGVALRLSEATKGEPTLISQLRRHSLIRVFFTAANDLSNIHSLTQAQARLLYDEVSEIELKTGFTTAMRGERAINTWVFDDVRKDWGKLALLSGGDHEESGPVRKAMGEVGNKIMTYLWRPVSYKDEIIDLDYWDQELRLAGRPYRTFHGENWALDPDETAPRYAVVTRIYFPVFLYAAAERDRAEAQLSVTQAAMALQAYHNRFGQYPQSLAQLKTKLGWPLPEDPFSGKPLIYKRTDKGFKLYSLGVNMKDDGGLPMEAFPKPHNSQQGDIVWVQTR